MTASSAVALSHALGPERAHEAVKTYFWIAFFTAAAEGFALLIGIYIFHRLSKRIKVLNNELKDLTRNVLHDLRTPISQINGEAELVLHDLTDAKSAASNITEAGGTLLSIVNANIEISRNYAGADTIPAEDVDITETVRETYEHCAQERFAEITPCFPRTQIQGSTTRWQSTRQRIEIHTIRRHRLPGLAWEFPYDTNHSC